MSSFFFCYHFFLSFLLCQICTYFFFLFVFHSFLLWFTQSSSFLHSLHFLFFTFLLFLSCLHFVRIFHYSFIFFCFLFRSFIPRPFVPLFLFSSFVFVGLLHVRLLSFFSLFCPLLIHSSFVPLHFYIFLLRQRLVCMLVCMNVGLYVCIHFFFFPLFLSFFFIHSSSWAFIMDAHFNVLWVCMFFIYFLFDKLFSHLIDNVPLSYFPLLSKILIFCTSIQLSLFIAFLVPFQTFFDHYVFFSLFPVRFILGKNFWPSISFSPYFVFYSSHYLHYYCSCLLQMTYDFYPLLLIFSFYFTFSLFITPLSLCKISNLFSLSLCLPFSICPFLFFLFDLTLLSQS